MSRLAVVIPAWNAARHLPRCVHRLEGDVSVFVADGGSLDGTAAVARDLGAVVVSTPRGRGVQLAGGASCALASPSTQWLLFLHADTQLEPGWRAAADAFMADAVSRDRAAVFRFGLDDDGAAARRLSAMVAWRVRWLALPYGDQGLLIHRDLYFALGGYRPLPLMEDVDIIRRIGRARLTVLTPMAITSAERWQREGWWVRSTRNVVCLGLYFLGLPPRYIQKIYG